MLNDTHTTETYYDGKPERAMSFAEQFSGYRVTPEFAYYEPSVDRQNG